MSTWHNVLLGCTTASYLQRHLSRNSLVVSKVQQLKLLFFPHLELKSGANSCNALSLPILLTSVKQLIGHATNRLMSIHHWYIGCVSMDYPLLRSPVCGLLCLNEWRSEQRQRVIFTVARESLLYTTSSVAHSLVAAGLTVPPFRPFPLKHASLSATQSRSKETQLASFGSFIL